MQINSNTLAMRLSLIISFCIVIIFMVFGPLTYQAAYNQLLLHLQSETQMKDRSIARDIQNNFENARIIAEQMAYNNEITTYLKTTVTSYDVTHNPLFPSVVQSLIEIKKSYSGNFLVWIANEQANFYIDSNGYVSDSSYDVKKRPWYPIAMNAPGRSSYTDPYIEYETKKTVLSNIITLIDGKKVYGFVVVDIKLDDIPAVFEKARAKDNIERIMLNKRGQFLYYQNQPLLFDSKLNIKSSPLKAYYNVILSGKTGFIPIKYKNNDYFLSYRPASDNGWVIISLVPKAVLTKDLFPLASLLILLFGASVLFLIVSVYTATIRKMKPIAVIAEHASVIAAGNLTSNLPEEYLTRTDEMGELAKACQSITDTFRQENIILNERVAKKNDELATQYAHILETEKMVALGSLVAGVAHEINTPLGIGLSSASFINLINEENRQKLSENTMTKADLESFMSKLNDSTEMLEHNLSRAAHLIKSFKQVAVNQSTEDIVQFNLKDLIDGIILSLRHEYKHQNHQLINECPAELELISYPGAYTQILTNLIMNSIQHSFADRSNGMIKISCMVEHEELKIIYTDDGIGIPPEIIDRIYEPFFTTQRQKGNSGLGLHIVFNIVTQKLKGDIVCENQPKGGVQFKITVPVHIE